MDFNRDKEFLLLNKDTPVLVFSISSGEFGDNYNVRYVLTKYLIPKDLRDLRDWLEKRYILSHRHSIKVFFNVLGISSMSDFIKSSGHTVAEVVINGEKWRFDAGTDGLVGQRTFSFINESKTYGGGYSKANGGWVAKLGW